MITFFQVKLVHDDILDDNKNGGFFIMSVFPYYQVNIHFAHTVAKNKNNN
jgi:hypothetical protein